MASKDNTYRFSLQWAKNSPERMLVGEFLERLKNKKSEAVVQIIYEYIKDNPEYLDGDKQLNIVVQRSVTQTDIHSMVQSAIADILGNSHVALVDNSEVSPDTDNGTDILANGLDFFDEL